MVGTLIFLSTRNNVKEVKVPDVSEMATEDAIKELEKKGFKYTVEIKESEKTEEGYVIKTSPKAGSTKKKGSTITIIESSGATSLILEDYTGKNYHAIEEKLKNLGMIVKVEKKSVENSSDYIGNEDIIIEQQPKFNSEEETMLEKGETVILYIPDIVSTYPDMVEEGWTLADAEAFAEEYGITLKVKDTNDKVIQDYEEYLDKAVTYQSRPAGDNIISGITLTIGIAVDTKTYTVTAYYYLKGSNSAIEDSKIVAKDLKTGEKGSYTCKGISGYTTTTPLPTEYTINGKNIEIKCYYEKNTTTDTNTDTTSDTTE